MEYCGEAFTPFLHHSTTPTLECPAKILEPIQAFFYHVDAGRVTETNGAVVAKGGAGDYRHVGFAEQTIRKILRAQTELTDVHENVKRALRFHGRDVRDLCDPIKHVVAPHREFVAHIGERLLIALQRGERAFL